jgi:hypothetical protein
MIPRLVRTPEALKAARHALGFSADGLARMVRVEDGRTVRRWESGEREIPGPVIVLMETAMGYLADSALITRQLEMLHSGKMRSGTRRGNKIVDDTAEDIARLTDAQRSLNEALEILTRQPAAGSASTQVHWYSLRRMTPLFDPSRKDEWSVPGERSPEAALAYFESHEEVSGPLKICPNDDLGADFVLDKREVLRSQVGASHRLTAGQLVDTYFVRRT